MVPRPPTGAGRGLRKRRRNSGCTGAFPGAPGSGRSPVRLDDRLRDASTVAYLVPVLTSPFPNRVGLLAVRTSVLLRRRLALTTTPARSTTDLAGVFDEGGQGLV